MFLKLLIVRLYGFGRSISYIRCEFSGIVNEKVEIWGKWKSVILLKASCERWNKIV